MRQLFILIQKEFTQIFRNPFLPKLFIIYPVIIMLVMPWVTTMDVRNVGSVKSFAQICFGIWQKSITGGGLTAPWLHYSGQGAKGQGRRYAACLALDHL